MRSFLIAVAAVATFAAPAAAQRDPRVFAHVNFGVQNQTQALTQNAEFTLYEERGTWETSHAIDSGRFFDVGGGVQILRNFSIGASYSARTKHTRSATVTASVPSPIFHDTFRNATGTVSGLTHEQQAVHVAAMFHVPVTVEFDVTLFGGPSFFTVRDQLVESVAPAEVGGNFSTVNLSAIGVSSQRNTATGFNVGLDARYMFVRNAGIGAMLRYSSASIDLTPPTNTTGQLQIDAGGLEIGAGLRFRF
ncbi:MAG TPA: outer membrane beta-barrel protein [Vicinamibacterales bacterium]|nr:outer membrane beta-barrel protein [Vicinamibacterales bacterium]